MTDAPRIAVRPETPQDIAAIDLVHRRAFPSPLEARLVRLLRDRRRAFLSLVATNENVVVGHILFSPVEIERKSSALMSLGLGPVAVLPDHQRQGVGAELMAEGLNRCRAMGAECVVLLGDPAYYARFGFQRAKLFNLDNEYHADDAFQAMELRPPALQNVSGLVRYAPEFNEVLNSN